MEEIIKNTQEKIEVIIKALHEKLTRISASGAHPSLLHGIMVESYGEMTPLANITNIKVLNATTLIVTPFDKNLLKEVVSAINKSNFGFNPVDEGNQIRINVPALTTEKREIFVKEAKEMAESIKVSIRAVRQESNKKIKSTILSENEIRLAEQKVQEIVNSSIKEVDEIVKSKIVKLTTV